jgi:hypothetical protein
MEDTAEEDPDEDDHKLTGALHEFYHAFPHVVSNLNVDISAFPVATRRMRAKAGFNEEDTPKATDNVDTSHFLNKLDGVEEKMNPSSNALVKGDSTPLEYTSSPETKEKKENYEQYMPYFLHVPVKKIRKTFENTMQHGSILCLALRYIRRSSHHTLLTMYGEGM